MTENQLKYLAYQESVRHNLATEDDARNRTGIEADKASETARSNLAKETETARANIAKETETHRANTESEALKRRQHDLDVVRVGIEATKAAAMATDALIPG